METLLLAAVGAVTLWLLIIAIISDRPQASLARGILASAGVVAGAWASTASANLVESGELSVLASLLRVLS